MIAGGQDFKTYLSLDLKKIQAETSLDKGLEDRMLFGEEQI